MSLEKSVYLNIIVENKQHIIKEVLDNLTPEILEKTYNNSK